jgi:hypothetical protein
MPALDAMVTAGIPALVPRGHGGVEKTDAPRLGTLGACVGAPRAADGRPTHLARPGHGSRRDALGVERPPCLAGALVRSRVAARARLDGRGPCGRRLARGQLGCQAVREPIQPPFEGFTPMAEQRPPVEDRWGLWCAKGGAARLRRRAVTAEEVNAWRRPERGRERVGCAIGAHVTRPMALHVHPQGALGAPTTPGPILHPTAGRRWHGRIRPLADPPPYGIGAGGHLERGAQPRPGFAAERKPKWLPHRGPAHRALRAGRTACGQRAAQV